MGKTSDHALVLVYNADSGVFNTLADIGHKLVSPETYSCDLCAVTHGAFRMREQWKRFTGSLELPTEYLHRDQFRRSYPAMDTALPAVFVRRGSELSLCLDAAALAELADVSALIAAIQGGCLKAGGSEHT
ncbi:MAG: hypothetical protein ACPGUC_00390 [Gammaproteobacteria bacterium]